MADTFSLADRLAAFQAVVSQHPNLDAQDRANLRDIALQIGRIDRTEPRPVSYAHLMRCRDKDCAHCRDNELAA